MESLFAWSQPLADPVLFVLLKLRGLVPSWSATLLLVVAFHKVVLRQVLLLPLRPLGPLEEAVGKLSLALGNLDRSSATFPSFQIEQRKLALRNTFLTAPMLAKLKWITRAERLHTLTGTYLFVALGHLMLGHASQLRGAPLLWAKDMTARDPLYVVPTVVFLLMVFMSIRNGLRKPSAGPVWGYVLLTVAFIGLASLLPVGLVFYMCVSYLFTPILSLAIALPLVPFFGIVKQLRRFFGRETTPPKHGLQGPPPFPRR